MILGGNLTLACKEVLYRVVDSSVTIAHLIGRYSLGEGNELVAEANTKNGLATLNNLLSKCNSLG